MRRFLIAFAVVAFCSASTWADSVLDVNAWPTTQPCSSNCTETIGRSFEYVPPSVNNSAGQILPGTLDVSASGFHSSFSQRVFADYYAGFHSQPKFGGDEIDLDLSGFGIQPGVNTVNFFLWACKSQACDNAFGQRWIGPEGPGNPSNQGSLVAPVTVPDGTSFLSLTLTSLGVIALVCRWRRKELKRA